MFLLNANPNSFTSSPSSSFSFCWQAFEDSLRKNRSVISNWLKYAQWEESQREIQRYDAVNTIKSLLLPVVPYSTRYAFSISISDHFIPAEKKFVKTEVNWLYFQPLWYCAFDITIVFSLFFCFRARSIYERALDVDHRNITIWLKYAEMEMK